MKNKKNKKASHLPILLDTLLKLIYSITFLLFLGVFYFLVLISVEPKSFPFVTDKIEKYINGNLSYVDQITIDKISIDLEDLYKININLENTNLDLADRNLFLPKISVQFSIINLIINQEPSKIKFADAKIDIDDNIELLKLLNISKIKEPYKKQEYIKQLWDIFSFFKKNNFATKEFEISNVDVSFKDKDNITQNIIVRHSDIIINQKGGELAVSTKNIFNLRNNKIDVEFNANCQFNEDVSLKCDAGFFNLVPAAFSSFIKGAKHLSQIQTNLSANFNLEIDKSYKATSILFNINSNKGNFYYDQFFDQKMNFKNLFITGELSNSFNDIKISELKVNFDQDVKFTMSMDIDNFNDKNLEEIDMYFKVSNSPGSKISKYWPVFLGPKIRDWVKGHIDQGLVKDAYANIKFRRKNNIKFLDHVDSEILFSKIRLKYHQNMPEIVNIDGIASFTKDNMTIDIVSGNVLDSKIKTAKVAIDNFKAKQITLKIDGSVNGNGSDPLKHANYKSNFSKKIDNYINGYSDSIFNIKIPIKNSITLNDAYIKVLSNIKNINSNYFSDNSSINVSTIKKFNEDKFNTYIDLSNAKFNLPIANIFKKKNVPSVARLDIIVKDDTLNLNNINWIITNSQINADILFNLEPFIISKAVIQDNYNNNYNLYYESNIKTLSQTLEINGEYFNLEPAIKSLSQIDGGSNNLTYDNINIKAHIQKLGLANNQYLNNLNININCIKSVCLDSFIKAKMKNNHFIDINLFKKSKKHDYTTIKGKISDISLLARGLNISSQVIDGNAVIKGKMLVSDNKINLIKGNLYIDDGFSIIKNEIFEKIAKDNAFERLRNNVDSSEKINFDELDLDFRLENSIFKIDKLIASSYLLGFTAKGDINLSNLDIKLKGLIIPGYSVNKLFGIGDIPVIGAIIMGEQGGGLFAARYEYIKNKNHKDGQFNINSASAAVPGSIRNIFGLFD